MGLANLSNIAIFQALTDKMRWHQARQGVLAQNIANADTPGYVESDLAPYSFDDAMSSVATVTTSATNPMHFSVSSMGSGDVFGTNSSANYEVTPSGNAVSLEDEMMKVTSNDIDYQTVTALYTRSIRLIRTALGRSA